LNYEGCLCFRRVASLAFLTKWDRFSLWRHITFLQSYKHSQSVFTDCYFLLKHRTWARILASFINGNYPCTVVHFMEWHVFNRTPQKLKKHTQQWNVMKMTLECLKKKYTLRKYVERLKKITRLGNMLNALKKIIRLGNMLNVLKKYFILNTYKLLNGRNKIKTWTAIVTWTLSSISRGGLFFSFDPLECFSLPAVRHKVLALFACRAHVCTLLA